MTTMLHAPVLLLLAIFQKMDTKSLCRFRQTCKTMDKVAEGFRKRIRSRPKSGITRTLFLGPQVYQEEGKEAEEVLGVFVLNDSYSKIYPKYVDEHVSYHHYNNSVCVNKNNFCDLKKIWRQLSGVYFAAVFCEGDFGQLEDYFHGEDADEHEEGDELEIEWITKSTDLLELLQLQVEFLTAKYVCEQQLLDLLDVVQFTNVGISGFRYYSYENFRIQGCKHISVHWVGERNWRKLFPAVLGSESAVIYFDIYKTAQACLFLDEIMKLPDHGSLKKLLIGGPYYSDHIEDEDITLNFYGTEILSKRMLFGCDVYESPEERTIRMTELGSLRSVVFKNGKRALLFYTDKFSQNGTRGSQNRLEIIIHFDVRTRQEFLDAIFPTIFGNVPYDLSLRFEEFMTAVEETDAMELISAQLIGSYAAHYEQEELLPAAFGVFHDGNGNPAAQGVLAHEEEDDEEDIDEGEEEDEMVVEAHDL